MEQKIFAYVRVSSQEQNTDRQIEALEAFGVSRSNIIIDKYSGKDTDRPGYQYLKKQLLREGDVLVIKELDRLSRNKSDIKNELEYFKSIGVRVKILDVPTTLIDFPANQMWVMDMINSILIEVLGSIAENERNKIRSRQREGIDAARKRNVAFGRPRIEVPKEDWNEVRKRVVSGEISSVQAMKMLGLKKGTYYNLCKRYSCD